MQNLRRQTLESHASTQRALIARGLLSEEGTLTDCGRREALLFVPLQEQCERSDLPFQEVANPDPSLRPEVALWTHMSRRGYIGSHCEGGAILQLLRAAALDTLSALNTFDSRSSACTGFTESHFSILADRSAEIVRALRSSSVDEVHRNFEEIYSYPFVSGWYPSMTATFIAALFEAIGPDRLGKIAEAIFENPYVYRNGWPDLTMVKGTRVLWIEVKTTDKLHMSQFITLERMKPLLPGEVRVVRLYQQRSA